jgi:endonuclease YncB( thermonuclease family)
VRLDSPISRRLRRGPARGGAVSVALAATTFALGLALGLSIAPGIGLQATPATVAVEPAPAPTTPPVLDNRKPLRGSYAAEVFNVVDGDTFDARVRVWPGLDITTRVRLRGIDAPELFSAKCAGERAKADTARAALKTLLAEGDVVLMHVSIEKYGRALADAATRATPDVSAAMLANGHARPYAGRRREGWCASAGPATDDK